MRGEVEGEEIDADVIRPAPPSRAASASHVRGAWAGERKLAKVWSAVGVQSGRKKATRPPNADRTTNGIGVESLRYGAG
ncbi:MAG: hypothetical protein P4L81_08115 [Candidatus Pacebacteria bacterium]|nr:hypothetical protein [Candidatus Paceibacterota bacterium]